MSQDHSQNFEQGKKCSYIVQVARNQHCESGRVALVFYSCYTRTLLGVTRSLLSVLENFLCT